ncbi:PstA family ABC transporter permease [Miltoncostaea oceani]|jgi:phosphate transport system permease protein|uniref:PstA family ABC transporter permease n=1 Tax=Miltoncostaea oceani TaxID=2843216 RepID=UPI001C3C1F6A|nr:ABC transporter permease subunit [Miltoncostaea oceani]
MATDVPRVADSAAVRPLRRKRPRPADALFHAAVLSAVLIALSVLAWLGVSIVQSGWATLTWDFLTDPVSSRASRAGFNSALRGSLVLMLLTFAVAIPVGFAAAIYLEKFAAIGREQLLSTAYARQRRLHEMEADGTGGAALVLRRVGVRAAFAWSRIGPPVNRAVEVNISNLAAVPSIIYGLLGLAIFVTFIGLQKSLLAGGLTLALLVLPIVIISSREALRAVPVSIEQGAMALGATRWQAVSRQVVPAAIPGMLTGTILAMSRALGESAPLIVVGGVAFGTQVPSVNPLDANETPLFAMPLQIFDWTDRPQEAFQELAAAGIIVLLVVLVLMNAVAIFLRAKYSRRW